MKKHVAMLLTFLVLTGLFGCGQEAQVSSSPEVAEEVQWRTEGFTAPKELEVEQAFWAGQYQPWEHEEQTVGEVYYCDSGVCGELFWHLGVEPMEAGESSTELDKKYFLEIYDTVEGETSVKCFTPKELGLEGMGFFDSMDMQDSEHFVLRWLSFEQNEEGLYHQIADSMVYTDLGEESKTTDFLPDYLDKGFVKDRFTELPGVYRFDWGCDGKGNIYAIDSLNDGARFYLWDKNGELLLERKVTGDGGLRAPLRTADGELILAVYEERRYDFLWVDTEGKELHSLVQVEAFKPYIEQLYGMLGDHIYYKSSEEMDIGIVRWNIKTGSKVQVMSLETAGVSLGQQTMLALREGQTPYLQITNDKGEDRKEWLTELTEQKPAEEGAVRVVNLRSSGELLEKCAAQASMENPSIRYQYENASAQEAKDRIMAELSQGKGPELLFVSMEELYVLKEKGLLMDIGELIPAETREELLPGVLEIGRIDGKLYGLPTEITVSTLMVSGSTWNSDTWRLEDIISLIEEGKLSGTVRAPLSFNGGYWSPFDTVMSLIHNSLGNSFLIDWEDRVSHFDDERFIKLLELTTEDRSKIPFEEEEWLDGGKGVATVHFMFVSDLINAFGHMEEENGKVIGYPTDGSVGSYLGANGVLVVNKNTKRRDTVTSFFEVLFSDELQTTNGILNVKKLIPEDYIVEKEDGRLLFMGNGRFEIPKFEDGTTALDRAKVFLENCVAEPPVYSYINSILVEELSAMYAENKSPRATAEIINRRVQLYLDEGN